MKTIAETLLELIGVNAPRTEREGGDPTRLLDATRDAYLSQPDLPAADAAFAPRVFDAVRAMVLPIASSAILTGSAPPPTPAPVLRRASATLLTAGVLIASILLGTPSLSVVLALALGLLAWFSAGGSVLGISPDRLRIEAAPAPRLRIEGPRAATRTPDLARLEEAFRQADALLARLREAQPPAPVPVSDAAADQAYVQFLQDLAESAAAQDGEHLAKLISRRLPSVLQGQSLRLATFEEAAPDCFLIDEIPDGARRGTTVTVRPAILRGDVCLARGYAHRYV